MIHVVLASCSTPRGRVSLAIAAAFHYEALLMTKTVILRRLCSGLRAAEEEIGGGRRG
jgi:hypothetical protein